MKKLFDKRGLSPLVATALLVLVAASAVFLVFYFTKSVSNDQIQKFGESAEDACNKISFVPILSGENILLNNQGTVPIYAINLEILKGGTRVVRFLRPKDGLVDVNEQDSVTASVQDLSGNIESMAVVPVILGQSTVTGTTKVYPCTSQGKALI